MADAFTGTSALSNQVVAAYDKAAFMALRSDAVFDQFARVKPGNVTSPGSSVSFFFWGDLAVATTALSETVDVDAVALSDSKVTLTPQEHGNAILTTIKVRTDSLIVGFDADAANIVAYNMVDSLETLAAEALATATATTVDAGAEASLTAGDVLTMNKIREQVAILRGANVKPAVGANYAMILHPDTEYDLMVATASTDWAAFVVRQGAPEWRNGMVANVAGVSIFSSPRAPVNTDAGASTADTYDTIFLGQDGFGKAVSIPPHVVISPQTDYLRRFQPMGWHAYLDYGLIRSASSRVLISCSSIGAN